jgi:type I restriction enzyme S subunit
MAGEWRTLSLQEANITLIDCDHRTPPATEAGYPYVAIPQLRNGRIDLSEARLITREHFVEWTRKAKPSANDVVLSRRCNPGETAFVPPDLEFALGQNLVLLRADGTEVYPPFLRWLVRGPEWWEQIGKFLNVGAIFDSLRCADVPNFELRIPPMPEQRAIAHILGTLDDKIELNRRMNETLEAMARALFKSWFVDFDPVRAKHALSNVEGAKGRDPGLPKPIADLFPDSFEDSELGEIPKAWKVGSIYTAAEVIYGAPFASAKFNSDGIGKPLIRIRDLADESPGVFTAEEHPKGYLVKAGDIAVGMDGEFRAYLWGGVESWLNQRVCVFKPRTGFSSPFVLHRIVRLLARVEATETATTVIHLGKNDIDHFKIVIPIEPILTAFGQLAEPLFQRIVVQKQESRTLAVLRDTLLPKLISGELRVNGAEPYIAEAMR